MKIVSKFHDYYDSAMAYGQEPGLVYCRESDTIGFRTPSFIRNHLTMDLSPFLYFLSRSKEGLGDIRGIYNKKDYYFNFGIIGFCGEIYPYIEFSIDDDLIYDSDYEPRIKKSYFYDPESAIKKIKVLEPKDIKRYFKVDNSLINHFKKIFLEHKIPTFHIIYDRYDSFSKEQFGTDGWILEKNPPLKEFEFFKVRDPFSAFQEIAWYIGGVLRTDDTNMVAIDEKRLIEKRGHDAKVSFRKGKEK